MMGRRKKDDESPEEAERKGAEKGVKDAWCTECHEWYDSSNQGQVNRHAH
jgi:hypothetical protein